MPKLREILNELVEDKIRRRGYDYFLNDVVSNLKYSSHKATATVKGTLSYEIEIDFDDKRSPINCLCTCPYSEAAICKHVVATLYKLNQANFFNSPHIYVYEDDFDDEIFEEDFPPDKAFDRDINISPTNKKDKEVFKSKQELIEEIKEKKEAARFNSFKEGVTQLIHTVNKKISKQSYKIAYAIEPKKYRTIFYIVRQKLNKDGDVTEQEIAYNTNFKNFEDISLQEKLIIDYISRNYGECSINLNITNDYYKPEKDHIKQTNLFSDILTFLSEREVYLLEGYRQLSKRIYIQNEPGSAELFIDEAEENISLKFRFWFKGKRLDPKIEITPILDNPFWILAGENIFKISNLTYSQYYNFVSQPKGVVFPKAYLEYFQENMLPQLAKNMQISSNKYQVEEMVSSPQKRIYLEEDDLKLRIILKFAYSEHVVNYDEDEAICLYISDNKIIRIVREKNLEETSRQEIKKFNLKENTAGVFTTKKDPIGFLFNALPYLKESGFEIFGEASLNKFKVNISEPVFSFSISSGIDWFDVKTEVSFNGTAISFEVLLNAIKHKREYVQLEDGSVGLLPEQWINKFKRALSLSETNKDKIRFSKFQANALDLLITDAGKVEEDDEYKKHFEKLNSFEKIRRQNLPSGFKSILRPYQKSGYDWFYFLKEFQFGGILADDMGLGKTIQVLALLSNEKKDKDKPPDLVIAPTSVVFNWLLEAKRFSPQLKILNHTGNNRIKNETHHFDNFDVVLTSYPILLRDIKFFAEKEFNYIILDESQKIKNPGAKTAKLARTLKSRYRLCLTGTPVENNLNELWSQISFLNPGMLGSLNKFQESFVTPVQKNNNDPAAEYLRKTVYPFILRRTKDVVAKEIPEKTEIVHYCEMDQAQQKIYNIWRDSIRDEILKEIETKGIKKSGFKVLEGLLRLRQICNHPSLVKENYKNKSGKFEEFKELFEKVLGENHKVLVFSQFVKMLEIIKAYLDQEKIKYEYLTGNTKDRESCVNNFQNNNEVKIFLISLKAGGFGLNLTAADYVFHYDPWWNPAVEAQATDRTHRIGQDKNVFVYKFITKDSVEEKILQLQLKKRKLVENIISGESGILKNLTKDDINILFS